MYGCSLGQDSVLLLLLQFLAGPNDTAAVGLVEKHEVAVHLHVQDEPPVVAPQPLSGEELLTVLQVVLPFCMPLARHRSREKSQYEDRRYEEYFHFDWKSEH